VAKPRRLPTTRRAVPDTRLAEINEVAATTGDDPELDTLLLRLQTETACFSSEQIRHVGSSAGSRGSGAGQPRVAAQHVLCT
jgi:hypothetical protein